MYVHKLSSLCFLATHFTSASQMSGIDCNMDRTREWKSITPVEKTAQKTSMPAGSNIVFIFEGHNLESFVIVAKNKYLHK